MRTLLLALCLLALPLSAAERVISLAPSLSEIMLDLDAADLLVGVLEGDERPAALAHLPTVGRYGQLEFERLLQLAPDLILSHLAVCRRRNKRSCSVSVSTC